jgi:hypothetical protein
MDITITGGSVSRRRAQHLRKRRLRYRLISKRRTFRYRRWQVDSTEPEGKISSEPRQGGKRRNLAHALPPRSDISTWSRKPCNPSTTRPARGCHPCLRYDPSPMSPGLTREIWSGRRDSNPRPRPWQGRALPLSYTRIREAGAAAPTTGRAMPNAGVECNRPLGVPSTIAFSSEVYNGSREENASKHEIRASALIQNRGSSSHSRPSWLIRAKRTE